MNVVEPIRDLDTLEYMCRCFKNGNINSQTKKKKEQAERNYIMFIFGIYSGLRISDILKLKVKNVKNRKYVELHEKKTNKLKKFPINKILKKELDIYIENKNENEYLFISQKGKNYKPLGYKGAYDVIKKVADEVGAESVATHSMRKTFGYHYYNRTKDIATLQKIFNHSNPETTLRYIGMTQNTIDNAYENINYF